MSGEFWNGYRNHFRQRSFKSIKAARAFKQYVEEDGMRAAVYVSYRGGKKRYVVYHDE